MKKFVEIFRLFCAWLFYQFYRYLFIETMYLGLMVFRIILNPKMKELLHDRENQNYVPLLSSPIWVHAASGEIEYAKPILRSLRDKLPEHPILLSYFSPSTKKLLPKNLHIDHIQALPFDRPSFVSEFLDFYKPKMLLIARTDLWPVYLTECRKRKIPILLFASTFSENIKLKSFFSQLYWLWTLRQISQIQVVSENDRANIQDFTKIDIQVSGDTRYDQVFYRLEQSSEKKLNISPPSHLKIFVAGSTWPEDEAVLIPAFKQIKSLEMQIVIAPHEITKTRLEALEVKFQKLNLSVSRLSNCKTWPLVDILLVDIVGPLAEIYAHGQYAFVGGSFRQKVHSVMEPLAAGLPVFVGPKHQNNREALDFQKLCLKQSVKAVQVIEKSEDLYQYLKKWVTVDVKNELRIKMKEKVGATQRVISWCQKHIH